jgi:chemotaxis protein CheD
MTACRRTPEASVTLREIVVNVADFAVVARSGVIVTSGLGSCVAIILYDRTARVAGLAHILLPDVDQGRPPFNPAKFPSTAVPLLVGEMRRAGAAGPFGAKLVGGARMFTTLLSSGVNMGERNVDASRRALQAARIPLAAEDVGGEHGRSVFVDVSSGDVLVQSLQRGNRVL